eukprot:3082837-Ditylum_brightwellii.AAC.1
MAADSSEALPPNQSYQEVPLPTFGRDGLPIARQLSKRRVWAGISSLAMLAVSWKKLLNSDPPPASSTKRADTTPESSRPSK